MPMEVSVQEVPCMSNPAPDNPSGPVQVAREFWLAREAVRLAREALAEAERTHRELHEVQEELRKAEARDRHFARVTVPAFLQSAQANGYKTTDGYEVSLERSIRVDLSRVDRARAIQWLDDNGHRTVADRLRGPFATLREMRSADTAAMRDFVEEQLDRRAELPLDLLGVVVESVAKIRKNP
jgi:hypothetical protein